MNNSADPHRASAERLALDGDEDGWHLLVEDDEGNRFDFNIQQVAFSFVDSDQFEALVGWYREGQLVRIALKSLPDYDVGEAYGPDDPKHPDFHDNMAYLADVRRKRLRGE